jgi:hypothetical protein
VVRGSVGFQSARTNPDLYRIPPAHHALTEHSGCLIPFPMLCISAAFSDLGLMALATFSA